MKFILLAVSLCSFVLFSCNSDDTSNALPVDEGVAFYALNVGNNWTYEYYMRNSSTSEFEQLDCVTQVEITGTTQISDHTYFIFETVTDGSVSNVFPCDVDPIGTRFLRDSLGYLVDSDGAILYSRENNAPYLISDNVWGDVYGELLVNPEVVEVSAGIFDCLSLERFAILEGGTLSNGREKVLYSDGIGKVYETYSADNTPEHRWERRLKTFTLTSLSTD